MQTIIVLPDGETWNTLDGCSICVITDEQYDLLCRGDTDAGNLLVEKEIGFKVFGDINATLNNQL